MKNKSLDSFAISGLFLSFFVTSLAFSGGGDNVDNLNESRESISLQNYDTKGAIGGATVGGVFGGPPGAVVGGVADALLGESLGNTWNQGKDSVLENFQDVQENIGDSVKDFMDDALGINGNNGKEIGKGDRKRLERFLKDQKAANQCAKTIGLLNKDANNKPRLSKDDSKLIRTLYFFNRYDLRYPQTLLCDRIKAQFQYFVELSKNTPDLSQANFLFSKIDPVYQVGYQKCEDTFAKHLASRDMDRVSEIKFLSVVFYRAALEMDYSNDQHYVNRCRYVRNNVRYFSENYLIRNPLTLKSFMPFDVEFGDAKDANMAARNCVEAISGSRVDQEIFRKSFARHNQSNSSWAETCNKVTVDARLLLQYRSGEDGDSNPEWVLKYDLKNQCRDSLNPIPSSLDSDAVQIARYLGGVVGYNYKVKKRDCKKTVNSINAFVKDFSTASSPPVRHRGDDSTSEE